MKRISKLPGLLLALFLLASMGFSMVGTAEERVPMKVGDYVEFGSYLGARILWRVMEINDGQPLLWSEYILSAKCFDAAESGTAGEGSSNADIYGSNVWSRSNLREWLNSTGKVSWITQSPTSGAIFGNNNYEKEEGFLTGFSKAERKLMIMTERRITDDLGGYKETTQDLVFLASYGEVMDGGRWGLNAESRKKPPTMQAAKQDRIGWLEAGFSGWYYLETPYTDDSFGVGSVTNDGGILWHSAYYSDPGVAPALHLSSVNTISGNGSKKNPWRY